jgi:hypothetical protein
MKIYSSLVLLAALMSSCATLNESLELGAGMGAATGLAAAFAGHAGTGRGASAEEAAIGAGIGMGLGLLTSFLVHGSVEERRQSLQLDQTEMQFGDLPPSPFIVPKKQNSKKGAH